MGNTHSHVPNNDWLVWVAIFVPLGIIFITLIGWALWSKRLSKKNKKQKMKRERKKLKELVDRAEARMEAGDSFDSAEDPYVTEQPPRPPYGNYEYSQYDPNPQYNNYPQYDYDPRYG